MTIVRSDDDTPWVEKYRPTGRGEAGDTLIGQEISESLFRNMVKKNSALNLLLYGPPGTGKTSQVLMMCQNIYTPEDYANYVLEINASYDRGIDVVRTKIKEFCKRAVVVGSADDVNDGRGREQARQAAQKTPPKFKFIILDEADTLSVEAQNALRRCIEMYAYNTRFCFICNYITNIIAPLTSRCFVCHFKALPDAVIRSRLGVIAEAEGLHSAASDPAVLGEIASRCDGDMRRCITTLQGLASMYPEEAITAATVRMYFNAPDATLVERCYRARTHEELMALLEEINVRGYALNDLIHLAIEWLMDEDGALLGNVYRRFSRIQYQMTIATDARALAMDLLNTIALANPSAHFAAASSRKKRGAAARRSAATTT